MIHRAEVVAEVEVERHLANVPVPSGSRAEAAVQGVDPDSPAAHVPELRVEVRADLLPTVADVDAVVRVADLAAVGEVAAANPRRAGLEPECREIEVLAPAQEVVGRKEHIHAAQAVVGRARRIAIGEDAADVGLPPEAVLGSAHDEVLPGAMSESRVMTSRSPISRRPTLPVSFSPNRIGTVSPPTSPILREKNGSIVVAGGGQAELKHAGLLQEEGPLLGEEKRESVRLTCRVSTSVSAKSVLRVVLESRFGVTR